MAESKIIKVEEIPVPLGTEGPVETRKWVDAQIPYKNWAGYNADLDGTIEQFVKGTQTNFRRRMVQVYDRWKVNWYVANGNSVSGEHEDDIHVAETYKMLQAKCARIEEAVWEYEPPFEVEGIKEPVDPITAQVVREYLRRELELAGYHNYVLPTIKDAQLCDICAIKVHWDRVLKNVVEREIELKATDSGNPYWRYELKYGEKLVREGAVLEQVRPERLLFDLDAGQLKDCFFVGDVSDQPLHELQEKDRIGLLKNVDKINVEKPGREQGYNSDLWDQVRFARSITQPWGRRESQEQAYGARRIEVTELYTWFDFKDGFDGVTDPAGKKLTGFQWIVITYAEGVVLQIRLNPFDKKFAPYGIAKMNANGHEIMAVAPFDNVIMVNAQYDRFQSNLLRHFDLSTAPIVTAEGESDLPDSILGIRPGTVFRNVGQIREVKISDIPQSVSYMHQYFRREHEELSGALRFWEGQGMPGSNTATETERRLQEANRTLRSEIRAVADMWKQIALVIYWMSGQFATERQKFQIVGKPAGALERYAEITPDMFQDDIDLRFIGLANLHVIGQRTTGMMQWMNLWGPLLPTMPQVNLPALMEMTWDQMVGRDNTRQIFPQRTPKYLLMDQDMENVHLRAGREVPVDQEDDDQDHLEKMHRSGTLGLVLKKDTPKFVKEAILQHFQDHLENAQKKIVQQKADMQQAQMDSMLMQQRQGGSPPPGQSAMPGQGAPAAPGGMQAQQSPITPGPPQARTVSRTGRDGAGQSQTQSLQMTG